MPEIIMEDPDLDELIGVSEGDSEEEVGEANGGKPALSTKQKNAIKREFKEVPEQSIGDYMERLLGAGVPVRVVVVRDRPKEDANGVSITGTIDTFDEALEVEDIKELYGGGSYRLLFHLMNAKGSWEYASARTVKISGPPKILHGAPKGHGSDETSENPSVLRDVLRMSREQSEASMRRAERIEREAREQRDPSTEMFPHLLETMSRSEAENRRFMAQMMDRRGDQSGIHELLGKSIESESARVLQLQARHESEIRQRDMMHQEEVNRVTTRYEQNMQWQQASHEREIATVRSTAEIQLSTVKTAHESERRGWERENQTLREENKELKKELDKLRSTKDKSVLDQLTEIKMLKETFEDSGLLSSGKEEEGSTIERIIGGVMGSPLAESVASRLAGPGMAAAAGAVPQQPEAQMAPSPEEIPVNTPIQMPDGNVAVRRPDGSVKVLKPKRKPKPGEPPPLDLDQPMVDLAVQYMENAINAGREPDEFAASARSLVPADIRRALQTHGVDHFLTSVAKLGPESPLLSMHGKQWARKVVEAL
jgi:hypothetical protein